MTDAPGNSAANLTVVPPTASSEDAAFDQPPSLLANVAHSYLQMGVTTLGAALVTNGALSQSEAAQFDSYLLGLGTLAIAAMWHLARSYFDHERMVVLHKAARAPEPLPLRPISGGLVQNS